MPTESVPGPYSAPASRYHQRTAAQYVRTIRVTATQNNPFTLTGSFANNSGFLVMNTGSLAISASNGQGYVAMDFHEPGQNHQIFPIALSYVSASNTGDITILYDY